MSAAYKLRKSRERWKEKAIKRADENRYYRRELARVKKERNRYKKEAREVKEKLKQTEQQHMVPTVSDKESLVYVTLQLFLVARISFRAVSRVLKVLGKYLGIKKPPCPQTVINWVNRLSISRIEHAPDLVGARVGARPFFQMVLYG